ncbi:UNVERIFIED_CONTAM: hypothetical protein RMT77_007314 [Armadillidium vulgare]
MNLRLIVCVVMILVSLSKAKPNVENVEISKIGEENPLKISNQFVSSKVQSPETNGVPGVSDGSAIPVHKATRVINPNSGASSGNNETENN